ncbi:type VII secretion protein EccE [Virgisporangium ochraceum]|uniref:type VII secretion protein EccE n=1 Tax=Virgisporangium ochraceum TaxID=65505 RepID=UPI001942FACB|nr:type VII secretion protein EccE [Virgisporangium ochraceum]
MLGPGARRLRLAQVVSWQLAAVGVVLGASLGTVFLGVGVAVAVVTVVVTGFPSRGRWLYQWWALRTAHLCRRRSFTAPVPEAGRPAGDPRRALLDFAAPGTVLSDAEIEGDGTVGVLAHPAGLTSVIEIQADDRTLYAARHTTLPALLSLLPAGDDDPLPTTLQVLVHAEPAAAGTGVAAESYRALTDGRVPAMRRCWLAVQVPRTPEFFDDAALEPALLNAVRRVRRRLRKEDLTAEILGSAGVLAVAALVARLPALPSGDGGVYGSQARGPELGPELGREGWDGWYSGGLAHTSYRVTRWPTAPWTIDDAVLGLPGTAVTASLAVVRDPARVRPGEVGVVAVVRVTAPAAPREAGARLVAQVTAAGGVVEQLDGRQRAGLAATLPLGWVPQTGDDRPARRSTRQTVAPAALVATAGGGGLMVGRDRHRAPVVVRVFRAEPTRMAFVGGLPAAQMLVLRMVALGAQVMVRTGRPGEWSRFVQHTGVGPGQVVFLAPGDPLGPPGRAGRPEAVVVDVGPVSWQQVDRGGNGRVVLIVRHELTAGDRDLLVGADVAVLQPLTEPEAAVAAPAVGAAESEGWLSRISASMVAVVNCGVVRWATLEATTLELRTLGDPRRS